jgi:hypothetical protein
MNQYQSNRSKLIYKKHIFLFLTNQIFKTKLIGLDLIDVNYLISRKLKHS